MKPSDAEKLKEKIGMLPEDWSSAKIKYAASIAIDSMTGGESAGAKVVEIEKLKKKISVGFADDEVVGEAHFINEHTLFDWIDSLAVERESVQTDAIDPRIGLTYKEIDRIIDILRSFHYHSSIRAVVMKMERWMRKNKPKTKQQLEALKARKL